MKKLLRIALPQALVLAMLLASVLPVWQEASASALRVTVDLTQDEVKEPQDRPPDVEVQIIRREAADDGDAPRVLIYHSHTCEAYEPDFEGQYKQTERWRTADNNYNVVRLGEELAGILREQYGMTVVHDDTNFELPSLDNAYARSLEALENYFARGETFDFYIDLHRDAYIEGLFAQNTIETAQGEAARLMVLVGTGEGSWNGRDFAQKPDWEENLALAEAITDAVNELSPGLCRSPSVKTGRYNQHVSTGALLVEVGNNRNTLSQALAAIPSLAQALAQAAGV